MSDVTYRICSKVERILLPSKDETIPREHAVVHKFFIEQRKGRIFKKWETVSSQFEMTDKDGNITYRDFKEFDEAEKYLMQKYVGGGYVQRSGNIYDITWPRYYY